MINSLHTKNLTYLLIFALVISCSGCVWFFVGSAVGALGGYAISRDTIQGETDKGLEELWESALRVLDTMDASEIDDSLRGTVRAKIGRTTAKITIEQLTPHTARVKVKCRKGLLPNLTLSEKLYVRIVEHAE